MSGEPKAEVEKLGTQQPKMGWGGFLASGQWQIFGWRSGVVGVGGGEEGPLVLNYPPNQELIFSEKRIKELGSCTKFNPGS